MDKTKPEQHTYIIVNPNEPDTVARLLQQILLEKLRAVGSGSAVEK